MKKLFITSSLLWGLATWGFELETCSAQPRLVLNNDPYIKISNSAYLVVDNSAANAVTTLGTGGNIISEGEFNRVKWNIGTDVGAYTVPFTKSPGNKIPLTVTIGTAGTGSGSILFSTYGGSTWDNSTYMPSDVTNMDAGSPPANNSDYVIDRFWLIDADGYTAKPAPDITFTYLDAEHSAAGNTINEAALFAQRFNPAPNDVWGDWFGPFGTANIAANTVSSGNVTPADFFRSWTLVDQGSPLPIELLYFTATVKNNSKVKCEWNTAGEINNDYFAVEHSKDGSAFAQIGTMKGAPGGNSSAPLDYEYYDNEPYTGVSYYRLKQVDFNGTFTYSEVRAVYIGTFNLISIYPNPASEYITYLLGSETGGEVTVKLYDELGREVFTKNAAIEKGLNKERVGTQNFASGNYLLRITNSNLEKTQKQFVIK